MHSNISLKKIPKRIIQFLLKPVRPWMTNLQYTVRSGPARGLKRRGGFAFLPSPLTMEDKFLDKYPFKNKVIYDIGANIGMMTVFFASRSGSSGFVYAFEPNPNSVSIIEEHLKINSLRNAKIFNMAIGEDSYESELIMHKNKRGSASLNQEIKESFKEKGQCEIFEIQVVPLDDLIGKNELQQPDFIKIDTEGFEYQCLQGMENILINRKPDLYIEMHGATEVSKLDNAKKVCQFLTDCNYKIYNVEYDVLIESNFEDAKRGHLYCYA